MPAGPAVRRPLPAPGRRPAADRRPRLPEIHRRIRPGRPAPRTTAARTGTTRATTTRPGPPPRPEARTVEPTAAIRTRIHPTRWHAQRPPAAAAVRRPVAGRRAPAPRAARTRNPDPAL
jgi:hypothetical protein